MVVREGMDSEPRFPLLRIMLGNAFLLSSLYLLAGVIVDALRRWHPSEWADGASLVVDSLPGRALVLLGAMPRLRAAYLEERLSPLMLRLIFSGTTVVIIFALALVVGAWMWGVRKFVEWRAGRGPRTVR